MKDDLNVILQTILYIEEHLKERLSVDQISNVAGFSKYHFTRLFSKCTGLSPYDYYRGRKITETVIYIQKNKCKIIEAALEYGFSSPEVFARASTSVFGKSPSAIRRQIENGTFLGIKRIEKAYLWFINEYNQEPVLKFMPELELMGIGYFSNDHSETLMNMSKEQLDNIHLSSDSGEVYKVSWLKKQSMGFMNFIGHGYNGELGGDEQLIKRIPRMAYLIFDMFGNQEEMIYFFEYVYNYFLPSSEYEQALPYQIELLTIRNNKRKSCLYVPVVPRT